MRHKPIPKRLREFVYKKYNGHCAYCGCLLDYKQMQVDHIHSLYATSIEHNLVDDPDIVQNDDLGNLMPSCRQCNYYKAESDIEGFRSKLKDWLEKTCIDTFQARLAMKYGILTYKPWDGKFYFEKEQNDRNKQDL